MVRIEVSLPEHVEEGSPDWHSALESIELSLGLGGLPYPWDSRGACTSCR